MNFARALSAYADAEPINGLDQPRGVAPIPKRWTAAHVARRMLDAFAIVDAITETPGPRAFGTAWPEMQREFSDLTDERAMANHRIAFEAAALRARRRPKPFEIDMAEEACAWASSVLPVDSQEIDALQLWLLATSRNLNVQRILTRRCTQADAMVTALRARMGVPESVIADPEQLQATARGVAATANILLERAVIDLRRAREAEIRTKPGSPKRIHASRSVRFALEDIVFARKLAVERVRKIALFEKLIIRPPESRIRRSEVMPGKVFGQFTYDERRKAGAEEIAEKLHTRGIAVR